MNSEELITQVDERDNVLGLKPKSQFNDGKLIHRSSYLLLLNSKREVLLQQRSQSKKWHPGKWTYPVAGTVANESYMECMKREVKEAFGIDLQFKKLFKYHHFDNIDKAFKMVFIAQAERNEISLNDAYAQNHAWIPLKQLKEEIKINPGKYAPPFIAGMKLILSKNLLYSS